MTELITVHELARRTKTKPSYWYERTRRDQVPGQIRLGKFIRIDWPVFYQAVRVERQQMA